MLHDLRNWDRRALIWLQEHFRRAWLTLTMKIATFLGNGGMIWLAACTCLLFHPKTRCTSVTALLSLLFSILINNAILKHLVARARPFDRIQNLIVLIRRPRDFSFPSGHTSSSFAVATVFLSMLPLWIGLSAMFLAVMIAFSRLYLGAHYPSDVACGAVFGVIFGLAALYLMPLLLNSSWLPDSVHMWFHLGTFTQIDFCDNI